MKRLLAFLAFLVTAVLMRLVGWSAANLAAAAKTTTMSAPTKPLLDQLQEGWAYRNAALADLNGEMYFKWAAAFEVLLDRLCEEQPGLCER